MSFTLTQRERLVVAAVYIGLLWAIYTWIAHSVPSAAAHGIFWFYSGALMIVLGRYVVEPYFTKPADAVVNAMALLVSLTALSPDDRHTLLGYGAFHYYAVVVLAISVFAIATKDVKQARVAAVARMSYLVVELIGSATVIFSLLYLSSSYSFFAQTGAIATFVSALALWICITFFDVVGKAVREIHRIFHAMKLHDNEELGEAIGCDNPLLYNVQVDHRKYKGDDPQYGDLLAIETKAHIGSVGMVVNRKQLLGKSWLSVYILTDVDGEVLRLDLRSKTLVADPRALSTTTNTAYPLSLDNGFLPAARTAIGNNPLYSDRGSFVGYIIKDSNINTIHFIILKDGNPSTRQISEGQIVKTTIYGEETLYQVINGNTREEHLEGFDFHGYTVGVARKLGKYNQGTHELETRKWMPRIYAPLFFGFSGTVNPGRTKEIARSAIGRLPDTDLEIRLSDVNSIVTHNTAILGILGIGKSCLAFELIGKVVATGVKVLCIDITNQYNLPAALPAYLGAAGISLDLPDAVKTTLKASKESKTSIIEGNPQASGNALEYSRAIADDLTQFLDSADKVKIYNPDLHPVSKGVAFKGTTLDDLTVAEKTRVIAERLFVHARSRGESIDAKYLLVLEEAHSLVPEWNSVSSDGDKNATNGTAKVILQGRKFGLGSLVVTQRTANVSKSILNQCNTIFAMRVFDDTGKGFLENYIGRDYADTLPTLEERHAIAIGKGLRLKQPVIIQLNDRSNVIAAAETEPADRQEE